MRNNGETNPATYLVIALVAAAGFYAFHVAPLYYDNLTVKEATSQAINVYILNGEKAALDKVLVQLNMRSPDTSHYETDEDGVETIKPGFGLTADNVTFVLDEPAKMLTVRVQYDRVVVFAPLKKRKTYHLTAEKTGSIGR